MLITIGSITTATRIARLIESKTGLHGKVIHTPKEINRGGCSYSIRYNDSHEEILRRTVEKYNIPARKWYKEASGHYDLC